MFGFTLSVADNENWVGSVPVVTSLWAERQKNSGLIPEKGKNLSVSEILLRLFTSLVILFRENKYFLPRWLKGWGVKLTKYLHSVPRQKLFSPKYLHGVHRDTFTFNSYKMLKEKGKG